MTPLTDPMLHKCQICGRLFAMERWLETHGGEHRREELERKMAIQKKLDDQWHADHPSWLMRAWNRMIDALLWRQQP